MHALQSYIVGESVWTQLSLECPLAAAALEITVCRRGSLVWDEANCSASLLPCRIPPSVPLLQKGGYAGSCRHPVAIGSPNTHVQSYRRAEFPRSTGRLKVFAVAILLALHARAANVPTDAELYRFRLDRLQADDHAGLLNLGVWCEEKGHPQWGRTCYRKVVQLGPSDSYPAASYRLARIEIEMGKLAPAFRRLRELVARHGHRGAQKLLAQAEDDTVRKQKRLLEEADGKLRDHLYDTAKQLYASAYELLPDGRALGPLLAEEEILPRAAACQKALDDSFRERERIKEKPAPCETCATNPLRGFQPCPACGDTQPTGGCRSCRGRGWIFCPDCSGAAFSFRNPAVMSLLTGLAAKLSEPRMQRLDLRHAIREIELILLEAPAAQLISVARLKPPWAEVEVMWSAIPSVPLPRRGLKEATDRWRALSSVWQIKCAFLLSYAWEYARFLVRYDLFRDIPTPLVGKPELLKLITGDAEPILRAVAFPEKRVGTFVSFEGTLNSRKAFKKYTAGALADAAGLELRLVAWSPGAIDDFKHLSLGPWHRRIGRLPVLYPTSASRRLAGAPTGWRYRWVGRFLRNPVRRPANYVELWAFIPLFPAHLTPLREPLEQPIHIALTDATLKEIPQVADTLLGLKVSLRGVSPSRRIHLMAEGCTVGRMLSEVARALDVALYAEGQTLVLAPDGPQQAQRELAKLIAVTARGDDAFLVAGSLATNQGPSGGEFAHPLAAYRTALADMSYGEAAQHLEDALLVERNPKNRVKIQKYLPLVKLGSILTGAVRISNFLEAEQLWKMRIRNAAGAEKAQILRILERKASGVLVQASYGARFSVPAAQLLAEEPIERAVWQGRLAALLKKRIARAKNDSGRQKASELFSAMILAKRIGLGREGHHILKNLIASQEFPWVLATFFPRRLKHGLTLWEKLGYTARREPEPGEGAPEPEVAVSSERAPEVENVKKRQPGEATPRSDEAIPTDLEELLAFGLRHLNAGKEHRRRSLPGSGDIQAEITTALRHFRLARTAFVAYIKQRDELHVQEKLTEATVLLQGCVKDLPFFE